MGYSVPQREYRRQTVHHYSRKPVKYNMSVSSQNGLQCTSTGIQKADCASLQQETCKVQYECFQPEWVTVYLNGNTEGRLCIITAGNPWNNCTDKKKQISGEGKTTSRDLCKINKF
eukprot:TRINITY_DN83360_c0_g1_i4.p1 TRINITY_DN83360_c0_g1~~TRINITY_DN83360_c0_g1_i4.p1  ORF type:complete len:116 (+),score=15.32 TRINITY_DN83360_c0_g1_i4:35-382(+)